MRMTRAALRAQAQDEPQLVHEDADAESLQEPEDPNTNQDVSRPALKDITYENHPNADDVFTDVQPAPLKKAKSKKKEKQGEKERTEGTIEAEEVKGTQQAQNCDLSQSSEEATGGNTIHDTASTEQLFEHPGNSTEAVNDAVQEDKSPDLTSTQHARIDPPKTPKFDPSIHKSPQRDAIAMADTAEDSFVGKIKSRSPTKMETYLEENKSPDSVIEKVTSRTPRIEDSVEAIDALEDAIEKVSERLPALDGLRIESPVKTQSPTPVGLNLQADSKTDRTPARTPRVSPTKSAPAIKATDRTKSTAARPSIAKLVTNAPVLAKPQKKPVIDGNKPRVSSVPSQPSLSFSNSPVKSLPNTIKKRVPSGSLSTSKPAFVPAKSTKPPTKPTFSLPGEVISAKLRAQREERMKREEEAEKEKKIFKARPVPTKASRPSVVPRETKASKARQSIYAGGVNKENVAPKPASAEPKPRPSSFSANSKIDSAAKANSVVRRTTSVIGKRSTTAAAKPRVSSMQLAAGEKSNVTKEDTVQQKAKGKEVFARTKVEMERLEKERKEKEEAARKARAEAAERGRQASREWAEKQKKKLAAQVLAQAVAKKHVQAGAVAAS